MHRRASFSFRCPDAGIATTPPAGYADTVTHTLTDIVANVLSAPNANAPGDERLLLEISTLAHTFVIGLVPKHSREDVAQDATLECLIRMRAGEWDVAPEAVVSYVFRAVERKAIDYARRRKGRRIREEVHGREMEDGVHAWMRPDISGADRELHALYTRTLESLPPACQRTYVMVREQGMSYEDAAHALGISRSAVSANIVRAQRAFRRELLARDVVPPPAAKGAHYRKVDPIIYEPRAKP
jgi:RNA polymerase sigma factor (sigma-70 family)